jgi:hypothetical protein
MTEREWLECTDPQKMLKHLRGKVSDRRLRLFACACVRLAWEKLSSSSQRTLELAELIADQGVGRRDWNAALREVTAEAERLAADAEATMDPDNGRYDPDLNAAVLANAAEAARLTLTSPLDLDTVREIMRAVHWARIHDWDGPGQDPGEAQCILLREIFGSPSRRLKFERGWRTSAAASLAEAIYDRREYDRLPDLADVLEDAGCTNANILEHLRGNALHVRGCWALDLVLEKA